MISNLNKILIFLMFLAVLFAFAITGRGQIAGFQLTGPLVFHGYYNGTGSWGINQGLTIVPHSTLFYKHLAELEGKKVRIRVEVVD